MTTINNIEDLARILETHPHWASTLRALVLSEEVLNLPQAMAALTASISRLSESVHHLEAGQDELRTDVNELRTDVNELRTDVKELRADVKELRADVTELKVGQEELRADVTELRADVTELKVGQEELRADVTELKVGQEELRADVTELKVGQEELRADVTELRADVTELKAGQEELRTDVTELKVGQEELAGRQTRLERSVDRLRDDIAPIKGRFAQNLAVEQSVVIALRMGLAYRSRVTQREMADLLGENDTSDLAANEIESLVLADLIFTAADANDELWYVTLEASYTADERDTRRAIRNAALLTRFTGNQARPVVASALIDDRIRGDVASGGVFWYALDETEFRATD